MCACVSSQNYNLSLKWNKQWPHRGEMPHLMHIRRHSEHHHSDSSSWWASTDVVNGEVNVTEWLLSWFGCVWSWEIAQWQGFVACQHVVAYQTRPWLWKTAVPFNLNTLFWTEGGNRTPLRGDLGFKLGIILLWAACATHWATVLCKSFNAYFKVVFSLLSFYWTWQLCLYQPNNRAAVWVNYSAPWPLRVSECLCGHREKLRCTVHCWKELFFWPLRLCLVTHTHSLHHRYVHMQTPVCWRWTHIQVWECEVSTYIKFHLLFLCL